MLCHAPMKFQYTFMIYTKMLEEEVIRLGLKSIADLSVECREAKWQTALLMVPGLPKRNLAYKKTEYYPIDKNYLLLNH